MQQSTSSERWALTALIALASSLALESLPCSDIGQHFCTLVSLRQQHLAQSSSETCDEAVGAGQKVARIESVQLWTHLLSVLKPFLCDHTTGGIPLYFKPSFYLV